MAAHHGQLCLNQMLNTCVQPGITSKSGLTYSGWSHLLCIYIYNYTELLPEPLYRALSAHVRANEIMRCLDGVDESL